MDRLSLLLVIIGAINWGLVETMPVPKDIVRGQTVEIRCELKAEGKFDGTIYTIRYFQDRKSVV